MEKSILKLIVRKLRKIKLNIFKSPVINSLPLCPKLPLPKDIKEQELFRFVTNVRVKDAPEDEMKSYATHDFKRFVYTWDLVQRLSGKCLELGANPYFTTMLLEKYSDLEVVKANYFGNVPIGQYIQEIDFLDTPSQKKTKTIKYDHFNIEEDLFPYMDNEFDVVIFAEIIEHLLNDPCKVLREIKRVLKPDGILVLTTPNVARLENVSRLISGINIYDPYSGYGPYGRHNREYNRHELVELLQFEGYELLSHFTADVHANNSDSFCAISDILPLIKFREHDLGQYIFIKAKKKADRNSLKRPAWLYRSYPNDELI